MTAPGPTAITKLLVEINNGQPQAMEQLLLLVYDELRRLAASYLRRERPDHTLQPTALVHEAYLRLVEQELPWANRAHFFGVAAQMMRRILIDHARGVHAEKRGRGGVKLALDEVVELSDERLADLLALDEALTELATFDPQKSQIVELRFFAGLSIEQTAAVLGLGTATVNRQWRIAKAWLHHQVSRGSEECPLL